jgi:predicted MFS family arabinose efflux permease
MSARQTGLVLVIVGVAAALLAVLANPLGIGHSGWFGWHQLLLLVVGIVVALVGAVVAVRASSSDASPTTDQ